MREVAGDGEAEAAKVEGGVGRRPHGVGNPD